MIRVRTVKKPRFLIPVWVGWLSFAITVAASGWIIIKHTIYNQGHYTDGNGP